MKKNNARPPEPYANAAALRRPSFHVEKRKGTPGSEVDGVTKLVIRKSLRPISINAVAGKYLGSSKYITNEKRQKKDSCACFM